MDWFLYDNGHRHERVKGKSESITESLTKRRVVELKNAREMYDFKRMYGRRNVKFYL